jgi:phosphotransferase system enzyme I (PtsP)
MKTITPDLRRRKLLAAAVTSVGGIGIAAMASILNLISSMLPGERIRAEETPVEPAGSTTQMKPHPAVDRLAEDALSGPLVLTGVASAAGLGLGEAVVVSPAVELESVPDKTIVDREAEALRFKQVVAAELEEIKRLSQRLQSLLPPDHGALFDAYILLLSSDSLMNSTLIRIHQGNWAPGALRTTILDYAQRFENLDDPYLQERAADIRDLGQRLLKRLLQPTSQAEGRTYPAHTILMAEEIGVSQLLEVPPEQLAGLVSVHGTGASHVALLARGLDIPAVFGVTHLPLSDLNRREVVVDGYSARVCIQPSPTLRQEYLKLAEEKAELVRGLQELRHLPALTPDGHHLELHANSGLFADIAVARESGAEGVGLHRSELNFYLFDHFPSEEEQTVIYTQVLKAMAPRPVVLRTLDVGGDKPLPYFPIKEQNPVLGWRGIRVSLAQPALFKTQLRAMLRAGTTCPNLAILFPMITCVNELSEVLELLRQAHAELVADGLPAVSPRVGLLVEVPSTVYQIDTLACRVDFVSIGSNDLTQYLLAVDRNNDRVATLYDSLHPAVLQAIQQVVERAHLAGRPVSVCGEMAGDPAAALLLLAMGVDKLSLSLGNLLKIKWMVRTISHRHAQALLTEVMQMDSAGPIRERLHQVLEEYGLGSLTKD